MATHAVVLVDGPPRCGKTILARQLAASSSAGAILARAGSPEGRSIMANPLALSAAQPVILDGATTDEARILEKILSAQALTQPTALSTARPTAKPIRLPRFVLVGGPFRQGWGTTGVETARTISAHLCLSPLTLAEVGRGSVRTHWLRGGYPEAYTAVSDTAALVASEVLIASISGGRLKPWGLPDSPTRLASLLTSLTRGAEGQVNESSLARMLGISRPTVCRWMEGLEDAGILRRVARLPGRNGARRTIQAPAWHIRDSGLFHALVGLGSPTDLRTMPKLAAASWLTYVLEQTAALISPGIELGSYLSADGACIDLVLAREDRIMAISTGIHLPASPCRGVTLGAKALGATECCFVLPEGMPRVIGGGFRALGLASFLEEVHSVFG